MQKEIVGRYELVSFKKQGDIAYKAKIDTGAQTNAIHSGFHKEEIRNGKKVLVYTLLGNRKKKFITENYKIKKIKSSNGTTERRFIVYLEILFHGKTYRSRFSLTSRENMNFPILIGRNLLRRGFIVDVSKKYISNQSVSI